MKLAAEEWAKGEPERQRRAKAAADAAAMTQFAEWWAPFYFGYLLPILGWVTVWLVLTVTDPGRFRAEPGSWLDTIILFIPVLNWLGYLGLLFFGENFRPLAWVILFVWSLVGGAIYRGAQLRVRDLNTFDSEV